MAVERIYALFQDVSDAERAIGALQDHGISRNNIGVVARRAAEQDETARVHTDYTRVSDAQDLHQGEPAVTYEPRPGTLPPAALSPTITPTSAVDTPENVEAVGKEGITTTTGADAAAGAAIGGGVGLVAGLLAAAAALAVPGVGIVLSGGILATALGATAATAAAGAVAGGVAGYLTDMGMSQTAAQNYADRIHEGDYLVVIDADPSRYDDLKQLLLKYNAAGVDINVAVAGADVPPAAVDVPPEVLHDITAEVVPPAPVVASVPPPPPVLPVAVVPETTALAASSARTAPPPVEGQYELRESQLVEPLVREPATSAPPRVPADPALAQETESMVATGTTPATTPGASPADEVARIERDHVGEGQDRA